MPGPGLWTTLSRVAAQPPQATIELALLAHTFPKGEGPRTWSHGRSRSCPARLDHPASGRGASLLSCGDVEANPGPPPAEWGEEDYAIITLLSYSAMGHGCRPTPHEALINPPIPPSHTLIPPPPPVCFALPKYVPALTDEPKPLWSERTNDLALPPMRATRQKEGNEGKKGQNSRGGSVIRPCFSDHGGGLIIWALLGRRALLGY